MTRDVSIMAPLAKVPELGTVVHSCLRGLLASLVVCYVASRMYLCGFDLPK
jgi:hypothetical protein